MYKWIVGPVDIKAHQDPVIKNIIEVDVSVFDGLAIEAVTFGVDESHFIVKF